MPGEAARRDWRLWAWTGLVGVTALLAFVVRQGVGLPEDFRYRYRTVLVGAVSNAIMLGIVVLIAGPGNLRELLALRRPLALRHQYVGFFASNSQSFQELVTVDRFLDVAERRRQLLKGQVEPISASEYELEYRVVSATCR